MSGLGNSHNTTKIIPDISPDITYHTEMETRVTQFLDAAGVSYKVLPHKSPLFTVADAVVQRNVPLNEVVKCILLQDKKGKRVMVCATGEVQLDLQAVRQYLPAGYKRMSFAKAETITELTGYVKGSVPPLDLPTSLPLFFDEGILERTKVNISSGDPNAGVELAPQDLLRLSGAQIASLSKGALHG